MKSLTKILGTIFMGVALATPMSAFANDPPMIIPQKGDWKIEQMNNKDCGYALWLHNKKTGQCRFIEVEANGYQTFQVSKERTKTVPALNLDVYNDVNCDNKFNGSDWHINYRQLGNLGAQYGFYPENDVCDGRFPLAWELADAVTGIVEKTDRNMPVVEKITGLGIPGYSSEEGAGLRFVDDLFEYEGIRTYHRFYTDGHKEAGKKYHFALSANGFLE